MNSTQDNTRHTCYHCQSEVLPGNGCTNLDDGTKRLLPSWLVDEYDATKWGNVLPMKHNPSAIWEAADSGCPFFVWLWGELDKFHRPTGVALQEATLFFRLEGVELEQVPVVGSKPADDKLLVSTIDQSCQKLYEITKCRVLATIGKSAKNLGLFETMSDWDDPSADYALARLVDGHTASSQALGQLRRQLHYCLAHHDDCKAVFSDITPRLFLWVGKSPDSMVKVIQAQNLDNGNAVPYAALSYCWGQDQVLKTTSANQAYVEDGIPLSSLPKTITDAIRVTRELGIELLWVDSLCLVQDKEDELAKEIAKMHHYYGNAHITISAAAAASCNEGFLRDYAMPRTSEDDIHPSFYIQVDLGAPKKLSYLKLCKPRLEEQAIDSRAWTLQEGLLSHRLVSFTSRAIRWSCRTVSYAKNEYDRLSDLHDSLVAACSGTVELSEQQLALKKLNVWCRVVENYTTRHLSNQDDRLPAISGIASVLSEPSADSSERQHQIAFMAGVLVHYSGTNPLSVVDLLSMDIKYHPQDHFETGLLVLQLLWKLSRRAYKKCLAQSDTLQTGLENQRQDSQPSTYIAPSWSWASQVYAVRFSAEGMIDEWFELFNLTAWEQGFRVREVTTIPRKSEAPYGALSGGSITLRGYIFRLDERLKKLRKVAFDDGKRKIGPGDCGGLFCFQITNINQHSQNDRISQLCQSVRDRCHPSRFEDWPQGIVLEPVELKNRFSSNERTYRRVGVYFLYNNRNKVEKLGGSLETFTII